MRIISFSGKLQSGKTTTARMLEQVLIAKGWKVGRYSFAKALKNELWEVFLSDYGVPREHLDLPEFKEQYRNLLTWFGTDFIRTRNPNHWVDKVEETLNFYALGSCYDFVIGDDTRFQNEYKMLNGRGALMVRMTRDNLSFGTEHSSETDLDNASFDLWVANAGTSLEDLKSVVETRLIKDVYGYFEI